ncbi:YhgE/Pip family protein [Leucobacter sp. HNU]|uniref:YhgE/Pip family protein n=1 Tax=Leucobacter sp. HNU TaxID=3236805 RepID=UPI003A80C3A4
MSLLTRSTELKRFKQGTLPKIALVVLLVIPLIYGALYLWAFWAPTDNLDKLPVAIVNLDESAEKPDGSKLSAGHDVVEQLQDRKDLDWKALDADSAKTAVSDGDVYFSVTIPKDFSSTLAGLQDDPKAGEIQVVYNDNNSFLASTLGKQAMVQLRGAVAETATQTAAEQVLVGVEKLSDGTRTAADAAGTLEQGTSALAAGSGKLSVGLGTLADGTAEIAAGAPALVDGTQQLANGAGAARDGSAKLAAGSQALAEGTGKVSDGATQLSAGAKTLSDKLPAAAAGATQLRAGMDELAGKAPVLAKGANDALAGSKELSEGLPQLQAGAKTVSGSLARIAALAQKSPNLTLGQLDQMLVNEGGSLNALVGGSEDLATKLEELRPAPSGSPSDSPN